MFEKIRASKIVNLNVQAEAAGGHAIMPLSSIHSITIANKTSLA